MLPLSPPTPPPTNRTHTAPTPPRVAIHRQPHIVSEYSWGKDDPPTRTPPPWPFPQRNALPIHAAAAHHRDPARGLASSTPWAITCPPATLLRIQTTISLVYNHTSTPISAQIQRVAAFRAHTVVLELAPPPGAQTRRYIEAPYEWVDLPSSAQLAGKVVRALLWLFGREHADAPPPHTPRHTGTHCEHIQHIYTSQSLNPMIQYTSFLLVE
ncbi:hypothetical protein FA95DRAFT_1605682 [Auriscalpium vulgare]|uniref:Uncharacterized protein n=1 Tax=Auriscalpium vulgare TaxID=40419 RepID=A0ACB8RUV0_9AGAM|nr:hypothetical protein FA95DRAFT_1605682 [Auriscalpium vulgare]